MKNFRFDWKLSILVLVLLPTMLRLGFWQLDREQEKVDLQRQYEQRQSEAELTLENLKQDEDLQYKQVRIAGLVDNEHVFLLDNKTYMGKPGFEVVQPLVANSGIVVLINRGWVAQGQYRADLPEIAPLNGHVELSGSVYVPVGKQLMLGATQVQDTWPRIVQTVNPQEQLSDAGYTDNKLLFPYTVRLAEQQTGVLVRNWSVISTTPEKHRGYAVQWFAMSIALVLLYLYYSTRALESEDKH